MLSKINESKKKNENLVSVIHKCKKEKNIFVAIFRKYIRMKMIEVLFLPNI